MTYKSVEKRTMEELLRQASQAVNADDDQGAYERAEASAEIERRQRALAEYAEKLDFPEGKPKPTHFDVAHDKVYELVAFSAGTKAPYAANSPSGRLTDKIMEAIKPHIRGGEA